MIDQIRAVFVLFHVVVVGLLCIPAPVGMTKKVMQDEGVQGGIAAARQVVNAVGWEIDQAQATDRAFVWGRALLDGRKTLLSPFRWYYRATGAKQGWRMFGYLNRRPARLELELNQGEGYRPLYVARSNEHTWRRGLLDQERSRAFINDYSWRSDKKDYDRFCIWVAGEVALEFPDALGLACQMRTMPIPEPEALRASGALAPGKVFWRTEHDLGVPQ